VPLFEYECQKCGQRTERIEKVNGPHLQKCPKCGGKVERLISAPAIQFKGSGWYVTDYGKSSSAPASKEAGAGDGAKSETKTESKSDGKSESKAPAAKTEKKPAAKSK